MILLKKILSIILLILLAISLIKINLYLLSEIKNELFYKNLLDTDLEYLLQMEENLKKFNEFDLLKLISSLIKDRSFSFNVYQKNTNLIVEDLHNSQTITYNVINRNNFMD